MSDEQQLQGPDLAQGIAAAELGDGTMMAGHFGGEGVLLCRRGDEVFAVGANCTHYGGPLAEGLLVDDTVRCPWHHACFSLRTGAALRAPALSPLPVFQVEQAGGRIKVTSKREPAAPHQEPSGSLPESIVIVGTGAAGNAAAERLRDLGYGGPVTMIGIEESVPYDRPNLSKDYLAGNAPEEWIPLHPRAYYRERDIELRLGQAVTAIDPKARRVTLADGTTLPYGALLLATGAEPVRLDLPGGDAKSVHVLRSFADSRALIAQAGIAQNAVIFGASFIGLEAAAALRSRGLAITVVAPDSVPLEKVMGRELGEMILALHQEHGVVFKLGRKPAEIKGTTVRLDDGEELAADLILAGVGVRPRIGLAEEAGLAVDNGVLVDEYLETSVPGIFAAGDIARWPDRRSGERLRVEHWVVAERQGQTAAANMLGKKEPFDAAPFFWSQHYDVALSYVGHAKKSDDVHVSGSIADRNALVALSEEGEVRAVITLGRDLESLEAELAMERGDEAALAALVAR